MNKQELLKMDVRSLFVDHKIEEIIEIERLLDGEIEKKKTELRSMVGDRYKDILHASESIKDMKNLSNKIVDSIRNIGDICEFSDLSEHPVLDKRDRLSDELITKERIVAIQMNLALYVNKNISICLDKEDFLTCAELFLLGQNIHTGLSLMNSSIIHRIPFLKHLKLNLNALKDIVVLKIIKNLESVELLSEQLCSDLIGLLLLQSQDSKELVRIFMNHRKIALNNILNNSQSTISVRNLINFTMRCLITTVHLLFECFVLKSEEKPGLIFEKLKKVVGDETSPILSKLEYPESQLDIYIPEIVKEFKPQLSFSSLDGNIEGIRELVKEWLEDTKQRIKASLSDSFQMVTNLKGLRIVKEEADKIKIPENWTTIVEILTLPKNFDVWYFFFQDSVTERAESLLVSRMKNNLDLFECELKKNLEDSSCIAREADLRCYVWEENKKEKVEGMSMKALGFSSKVVELCGKFDEKFHELLEDLSQYLYGENSIIKKEFSLVTFSDDRKIGIEVLQKRLVKECFEMILSLIEDVGNILEKEENIEKTIFCIRLLKAITKLCPSFKKCCMSDKNSVDCWHTQVCASLTDANRKFWEIWLKDSVEKTRKDCSISFPEDFNRKPPVSLFLKWDSIEIQEQITEEKIFKSQIKLPLKQSVILDEILENLNENIRRILPHTIPKDVHVNFIDKNVGILLEYYKKLGEVSETNRNVTLQLLFDVKFLTTFCVRRENETLNELSQKICDKLRSKMDPFDLDVFYPFLQTNVKRAAVQSQVTFGCLLPSFNQLSNLENVLEKSREQEKEPSVLAVSVATSNDWFPLLPVTAPTKKHVTAGF